MYPTSLFSALEARLTSIHRAAEKEGVLGNRASGVRGSRKPDSPGPIELAPYVTDRGYRPIAKRAGAVRDPGLRATPYNSGAGNKVINPLNPPRQLTFKVCRL